MPYISYLQWHIAKIREEEKLYILVKSDNEYEKADMKLLTLKSEIQQKIDDIKVQGNLDKEKTQENKNELKDIVSRGLSLYKPLFNQNSPLVPDACYWIHGNISVPYPNAAFMSNSDMSYFGMAENVGRTVVIRFQRSIASLFYRASGGVTYRIKSNHIFDAIDKMKLTNKQMIISFGIYWDYYISLQQVGFAKVKDGYKYNDIDIINLPTGAFGLVEQSLFVVNKDDLPSFEFVETPKTQVLQYSLEKIDDVFKLYTSLLPLSKNPGVAAIVQKDLKELKLKDQTLFSAFITSKISWSKFIPLIQLKLMYSLGDNGSTDNLDDITPFNSKQGIDNITQRAEAIAISELSRELNVLLSKDVKLLDAIGEKDGKTIYVEVKYSREANRESLMKAISQFNKVPREENYVFYIAMVSEHPLDETSKKSQSLDVKEMDPNIELRFYSLYR